jgi:hypothetical protein
VRGAEAALSAILATAVAVNSRPRRSPAKVSVMAMMILEVVVLYPRVAFGAGGIIAVFEK